MRTKKTFLLAFLSLTLFFGLVTQIKAQKIEITPLIGYETGAKLHTNLGTLHIGDGMNFGGSLDIGLGRGRFAELSYTHMKSYLNIDEALNVRRICDLAVDYYSIGILQEVKPNAKVTPYGLLTLGLVNYRPTTGEISSENKMHVSLTGGIKIHATEKIGLRLQARLLMPVYYDGTYFSIGSGGAGYGIAGGVIAVQGDFTAALVFAF